MFKRSVCAGKAVKFMLVVCGDKYVVITTTRAMFVYKKSKKKSHAPFGFDVPDQRTNG